MSKMQWEVEVCRVGNPRETSTVTVYASYQLEAERIADTAFPGWYRIPGKFAYYLGVDKGGETVTSRHNIEDLVKMVRDLPPSAPEVVTKFAIECYSKGADDGTVDADTLKSIVMEWPGACAIGRQDFLDNIDGFLSTDTSGRVLVLNDDTGGFGMHLRAEDTHTEGDEGHCAMHIAVAQDTSGNALGRNLHLTEVRRLRDLCNQVLGE